MVSSLLFTDIQNTFAITKEDVTQISLSQFAFKEAYYEIYDPSKTAATSVKNAGTESINTSYGNLTYKATDLTLPGKNGFDLNVTREYNSNESIDLKGRKMTYYITGKFDVNVSNESDKFVYKYYVDGNTSNPVYIAYDSEALLLEKEDNGMLHVASDYTEYITPKWKCVKNAKIYYTYELPTNADGTEFVYDTPFYLINALPDGEDTTLVRDMDFAPVTIVFNDNGACVYDWTEMKNRYNIGNGWSVSMPEINVDYLGIAYYSKGDKPKIQEVLELGTFVDPDNGFVLSYYTAYIDWLYTGYSTTNANIQVWSARIEGVDNTVSAMYSIDVGNSIYEESAVYPNSGNKTDDYHLCISRYDGVKYYLSPIFPGSKKMTITKKEDRFGNAIYYYGKYSDVGIIDTYGRRIEFVKSEEDKNLKEIKLNGTTVVKYELSKETDSVDPNDYMYEDDLRTLKVQTGLPEITDKYVLYKGNYETELWYIGSVQDNSGARTTLPIPTFKLKEIELSTGGKIKYEYLKVQECMPKKKYLLRDKCKISSKAQYNSGDDEPINAYTYSYDTTDMNKRKTTTQKVSENYKLIETYNENNVVTESRFISDNGIVEKTYTYTQMSEANYLPTQIITVQKDKNGNNAKQVTVTKEYNRQQQLTKEADGVHDTIISYGNYGLLTGKYQKQKDDYYVGIYNELTRDGKSIQMSAKAYKYTGGTNIYKYENEYYTYNTIGELTMVRKRGDSYITLAEIEYEYPDISVATSLSDIALIKTSTIPNVEGLTDENGENPQERSVIKQEYFDLRGNMVKSVQNGRETLYEYDSLGRIIKMTNPDNTYKTVSYDNVNNIVSETNENNYTTTYFFDSLGRQIKTNNYNNNLIAEINYDNYSRMTKKKVYPNNDNTGNYVEYTYYSDNSIKSETVKEGRSNGDITLNEREYEYLPGYSDTLSATVTKIITNSETPLVLTEFTDVYGRKVKDTVSGEKNNTNVTYTKNYETDILGNVLKETDFKGNQTKYTYDFANRMLTSTNAANKVTTNTYDTIYGNLASVQDKRGYKIEYTYNKTGQLIATTLPLTGHPQQKQYYDVYGNNTRFEQPIGTSSSDERYAVKKFIYDNRNRLTALIENDGTTDHITRYEYDNVGNNTRVITGLNGLDETINPAIHSITTTLYNGLNLPERVTDSLGNYIDNEYDNLGNLVFTCDRDGKIFLYSYDGMNRLVEKSGDTENIMYTYDKVGNLICMSDLTGNTNYTYNGFGELIAEVYGDITKNYAYDENGNRIRFTILKSGVQQSDIVYSYDNLNQLSELTSDEAKLTFSYDANGNLLSKGGDKYSAQARYSYDELNRRYSTSNCNYRFSHESYFYTFDYAGNVIREAYSNRDIGKIDWSKSYTYDNMGRLKSESISKVDSTTYTYDNFGNRSSMEYVNLVDNTSYARNYTYDLNNRLTQINDNRGQIYNYIYDDSGNLIKKTSQAAESETISIDAIYTYDGFNRLSTTVENNISASYEYDGSNLRRSKSVSGVTTEFVYDGQNIVETIKPNEIQKFLRGYDLILRKVNNGDSEYYYQDNHGNVTTMKDTAGKKLNTLKYDSFGNTTLPSGYDNPFRYCGEYMDDETGLVYLRNRYYDPSIGRFITEDPVKSGLNWYAYCENNPLKYVDPFGLTISSFDEAEGEATVDNDYILKNLQSITDDTLLYDEEAKQFKILEYANNDSLKYSTGTNLVRSLIESDKDTKILLTSNNSRFEDGNKIYSTPNIVCLSTKKFGTFMTQDKATGNVLRERGNAMLNLAHELVHAYHYINNRFIDNVDENKVSAYVLGNNAEVRIAQVDHEEAQTVGLAHDVGGVMKHSYNNFTENAIRQEHGFNIRVSYSLIER